MTSLLSHLRELPTGVASGNTLIAGLDACLLNGFARLGPAQHEALGALGATFHATPLQAPLGEALAAVKRSEFLARHFVVLAAGRAAIQGAQYDALLQQADEALQRKRPAGPAETPGPISPDGAHVALLSSAQQWLMELALAGFRHLSMDTLMPFMATLEQLQAEPKIARLASLLTGFLGELLAATPVADDDLPVFRWSDLWARAMLGAQQPPVQEAGAAMSGTLQPLGVDVRAHAHFANVVVYGLLTSGAVRRVVRIPLSSYKVDVIAQKELWHLFRPMADPILESLAGGRVLEIAGMPLLAGGDLLWAGGVKLGAAGDVWAAALQAGAEGTIPLAPVPPLIRHPVQLAELVCFENCTVHASANRPGPAGEDGEAQGMELLVNGDTLPLASERFHPGSELDPKTLLAATALVGLLRFDRGAWAVQPLAARTKSGKKQMTIVTGSSALAFCQKDKAKTLATLSERASKLLRA